MRVGDDAFGSPLRLGAATPFNWPAGERTAPPASIAVRRITTGASILRTISLRETVSLRVGVIARIGFRSSVRTKAGAASSLAPREGAVTMPRGGAGAFKTSCDTRTRPLVNLPASIPLTPPGEL